MHESALHSTDTLESARAVIGGGGMQRAARQVVLHSHTQLTAWHAKCSKTRAFHTTTSLVEPCSAGEGHLCAADAKEFFAQEEGLFRVPAATLAREREVSRDERSDSCAYSSPSSGRPCRWMAQLFAILGRRESRRRHLRLEVVVLLFEFVDLTE